MLVTAGRAASESCMRGSLRMGEKDRYQAQVPVINTMSGTWVALDRAQFIGECS